MPVVVVHPAEPDVEPVLPIHMEEVEDRVVSPTVDKVAWVLIMLHTLREIDDEESLLGEVDLVLGCIGSPYRFCRRRAQ